MSVAQAIGAAAVWLTTFVLVLAALRAGRDDE